MAEQFGSKIEAATAGTPFPAPLLAAIVCQETAIYWVSKRNQFTPEQLLALCVFDASGDVNHDRGNTFPADTSAFRSRLGDEFADMLIAEANKMRRELRGWGPASWVYDGYGIFQYDLQFVLDDEAFFREKQWYDFEQCLARVMKELKSKYTHDLWDAVQAYNGSGPRAERYRRFVQHFFSICERNWSVVTGPIMTVSQSTTLWQSSNGTGVRRNLMMDPSVHLRVRSESGDYSHVDLLGDDLLVVDTGWILSRLLIPIPGA
ncbi:MAG: hypothetical protein ABL901_05350 [Hyphomicrobiaceae bacterium]